MPNDLMIQTCRRVGIVSVVFGSVWAFMTILNNIFIQLLATRTADGVQTSQAIPVTLS